MSTRATIAPTRATMRSTRSVPAVGRVQSSAKASMGAKVQMMSARKAMGERVQMKARSQQTARATRFVVTAAKNTIIAGAPASGKGTQCEGIVENFGLTHISTGDMLRAAVKAGTDAGKAAKEFMDAGKLVPDEVIIAMVKDRLGEEDCKTKGWLLDGFPRTGAQADALVEIGVSPDVVLLLNVPDEELIKRVVGRRSDPETGKIYHVDYFPAPAGEVADRCIQRSDDTEEACRSRLGYYYENLEALKNAYSDKMVSIDGNQDKALVGELIAKAMV